jgi:DNA-binding FadR family transcriptional regulator
MRSLGVSRNGKRGALIQLRRAGLIAVEERSDKNPIVTVRWVD